MKQCALYVTTGTEYSSELLEYSVVILNKVCLKKYTNDIKNILGNLFYDMGSFCVLILVIRRKVLPPRKIAQSRRLPVFLLSEKS